MILRVNKPNLDLSVAYSCLGQRCLNGDVEAVKFLYSNIWLESPPHIKTIAHLQNCLTGAEIEKDATGIYCNEFLYYWGMANIGELSRLIAKDLGTAEICFNKIRSAVPKTEARLAYVSLLISDEPNKSDSNVTRLDTLRQWAGRQDYFSSIALSKIIYYQFLLEKPPDSPEQPIRAIQLLELPRSMGHPVAVKFFNEIVMHMDTQGVCDCKDIHSIAARAKSSILYDY